MPISDLRSPPGIHVSNSNGAGKLQTPNGHDGVFYSLSLPLRSSSHLACPKAAPCRPFPTVPGLQWALKIPQDDMTASKSLTHVPRPNINRDEVRFIQVGVLDLHQLQQLAEGFSFLGATQGAQGMQGSGAGPRYKRAQKPQKQTGSGGQQHPGTRAEGWP